MSTRSANRRPDRVELLVELADPRRGRPFGPPLLLANHRLNRHDKARAVASLRSAAHAALLEAHGPPGRRGWFPPSLVTVRLHRSDRRATDVDAIAPAAKPIVDGLVDAGAWPTDTPLHFVGLVLLPPVYGAPRHALAVRTIPVGLPGSILDSAELLA